MRYVSEMGEHLGAGGGYVAKRSMVGRPLNESMEVFTESDRRPNTAGDAEGGLVMDGHRAMWR